MGFLKKFENRLVAPKADLNLQLDANYAVLGEALEGALVVSPHEDIEAEEIRCELNCTETAQVLRMEYDPTIKRTVPRQVTETRTLYSAKPACNPATQLINGVTKQFRFSINIPIGARATFQSVNDMVEWKIKGVIAVHGRPDVTTKAQSFVVILQSEKPANESAKVRLVACEYCKAAMPETVLECPNCGAHRTV
jgi:RNA polymerase subunit RPABC4/transcription elongation factor Spt4